MRAFAKGPEPPCADPCKVPGEKCLALTLRLMLNCQLTLGESISTDASIAVYYYYEITDIIRYSHEYYYGYDYGYFLQKLFVTKHASAFSNSTRFVIW